MRTDAAPVPPALATALEVIRSRGLDLRRGAEPPVVESAGRHPPLPSGHPALDAALGAGGWPRGALALLDAPAGGGGTTLALATVAAAQAAGGLAAWLDLDGALDPAAAARLGVGLEWLLVARPRDAAEAIDLAGWLGRSGLLDLLVLDLGAVGVPDRRALDRLGSLLARAGGTTALILAPAARAAAGAVAGVRVALRRTAWLALGRDLVGQRVAATVERQRWGLAGGATELDLWFAEGRRLDALAPGLAEARPLASVGEPPALRVVGA